ncbi:heat-shock protein Hsp20 [Pseudoroseomonas deserti]|uniref:Heat-shock protein Hsp20 n=1 Tax=Teichococcus deserti TaxID=1817963 RepID=A0A1V2H7G3_9PROT|nr:Hsp20 family protein [Pseudoroseomonas deserti]ONG58777.1 heat-shock protein Hsp20 [Pseudoroseomonas deserti]
MSRSSLFGSPLFLGFDHLEQMLDRVAKNADGYPPYNIEQTAENRLRITLAVAGFSMDDLQITQEDNQLVVRGKQRDESEGRVFLHRGIAARQFHRAFVLAEGIDVEGAWLDNGLLHIDLKRPQPAVRVKAIQIGMRGSQGGRAVVQGSPQEEGQVAVGQVPVGQITG